MTLRPRRKRIVRSVISWGVTALLAGGVFWAISVQELRISAVLSDSMTPGLAVGDAVIWKGAKPIEFREGDVIVFDADINHDGTKIMPVVHRYLGQDENGILVTKGDHNADVDPFMTRTENVKGVMVGSLPLHYLRNGATFPLSIGLLSLCTFFIVFGLLTRTSRPSPPEPGPLGAETPRGEASLYEPPARSAGTNPNGDFPIYRP